MDKDLINPTLPYNFIDLNEQVIPSALNKYKGKKNEILASFINSSDKKYTGYFDLEIKNRTPLFIGIDDENSSNFLIGDKIAIPGSTLRGCLKNIFKILTYSDFRKDEDFEDRHLYYRSFINSKSTGIDDKYSLKNIYDGELKLKNTNKILSKRGFLVRTNEGFFIYPTTEDSVESNRLDLDKFQVLKDRIIYKQSRNQNQNKGYPFNCYMITDLVEDEKGKLKKYEIENRDTLKYIQNSLYNYNKIHEIKDLFNLKDNIQNAIPCFYKLDKYKIPNYISGRLNRKLNGKVDNKVNIGVLIKLDNGKYYIYEGYSKSIIWSNEYVEFVTKNTELNQRVRRFKGPDWSKERYSVKQEVIKSYRADTNRSGLDLLAYDKNLENGYAQTSSNKNKLKILNGCKNLNFDYIIPCFYVLDKDNVKHFGASKLYRVPYKNSISKHLPRALDEENKEIDFTDAVFGTKDYWQSRVFFEDCFLQIDTVEQQNFVNAYKNEKGEYIKALMKPNPTSYQFYLEPNKQENQEIAYHWDMPQLTNIRGYKQYWHQDIRDNSWIERESNVNKEINKQIKPIKKDSKFVGRIRFENLSECELGALCTLLYLSKDKNCYFKLGRGKPYGLGSIRIDAKLFLQKDNYYNNLFSDCFEEKTKEVDEYKKIFKDYMERELEKNSTNKSDTEENTNMEDWKKALAKLNHKYYDEESRIKDLYTMLQFHDKKLNVEYMSFENAKNILQKRKPLPHINDIIK